MSSVTVSGLTKHFGATRAVDAASFDVLPGRVTGLIGSNGAGKTTTLRMLLGLVRPDSGTALLGGHPYHDLPQPRRVVGAVLESGAFHPGRRGRDHLRVLARPARISDERVDELLDAVRLTAVAHQRVGTYSLGMRQRLALAGALLGNPEILLLDEPANGLDPEGMAWLRGLLRELAGNGCTVLVSSHVLSEVARTVDDLVVLAAGRLRYVGTLAAATQRSESFEAAFLRMTALDPA